MIPLKFIHAADLHLDSPFRGLRAASPALAEALQGATFAAFDRLVQLCLDQRADFLLVAGDVFNSSERSLAAQLRFRDGLRRLDQGGVRAFVVHGNHDPLDGGWSRTMDWPGNVTLFPGDRVEAAAVLKDGREAARVLGISFPTREVRECLVPRFPERPALEETPFAIGLMHANLDSDTAHAPYAPCTRGQLAGKGYDYWALGHVHTRRTVELDGRGLAVYPGNCQGLHPGEGGPRGAMVVSVGDSGRVEQCFEPLDSLRWLGLELDLSALESPAALLEAAGRLIEAAVAEHPGRQLCLRLGLTGRGPLHRELSRGVLRGELEGELRERWAGSSPLVWVERVEDCSRPAVDLERRKMGEDFLGALLREFDELKQGRPKEREELLAALQELFGKRQVQRQLGPVDEALLEELLERARLLLVDRFLEREEGRR